MIEIGYHLSSEEHGPKDLVRFARRAEEAGFSFATISDHYHPWLDRQGQSPFVWSVIGGIAATTERLRIGTAVTCPIMRIHPAIVAQAAATAGAMLPGRFFLGLGAGEHLNEHILGQHWPRPRVRLEMLAEALEVIRLLWRGGVHSHTGRYFTVESARIYTLPDERPPIYVAAATPRSARLAGGIADGLISTSATDEIVGAFDESGGTGKPRYAQIHVCWAADEASARRTAHELWPTSGLGDSLGSELPEPRHFQEAVAFVPEDAVAKKIACGPDPEKHLESIRRFADAGFTHVSVHQVGPDQDGFFRFYESEVLPRLRREAVAGRNGRR